MSVWYSRPVFFVESVERSIAFYTTKLGFIERVATRQARTAD
jgi:hypothetical protein